MKFGFKKVKGYGLRDLFPNLGQDYGYKFNGTSLVIKNGTKTIPIIDLGSSSSIHLAGDAIIDLSAFGTTYDKTNGNWIGLDLTLGSEFYWYVSELNYRLIEEAYTGDFKQLYAKLEYTAGGLNGLTELLIYDNSVVDDADVLNYIGVSDIENQIYLSNFSAGKDDFSISYRVDGETTIVDETLVMDELTTKLDNRPIALRNGTLEEGENVRFINKGTGIIKGIYYFGGFEEINFDLSTGDYEVEGIISGSFGENIYTYYNGLAVNPSIIEQFEIKKLYYNSYNKEFGNLSDRVYIKKPEFDKHFGFGVVFFRGDRMYTVYRDARSHQSYDNTTIKIAYSDDYINFSTPVTLFTGQSYIDANPDVLVADPKAKPDARDIKVTELDNGNMLMMGFIGIGHNLIEDDDTDPDNIDRRVDLKFVPFALEWNEVDGIINENYLTREFPFSGGLLNYNSKLYTAIYQGGVIEVYESIDNMQSISILSTLSSTESLTEAAIIDYDSDIYLFARGQVNTIVFKSTDNGGSWTEYDSFTPRIASPVCIKKYGYIGVYGRDDTSLLNNVRLCFYDVQNKSIVFEQEVHRQVNNADTGYGNMVEKNGEIYSVYMAGQTREAPNPFDHTYAGMCYRKILSI